MLLEVGQEVQGDGGFARWAIGGLVGAIVALAAYIANLHKAYSKKVNEVYEARIADLKANLDLVETLIRVVGEERKGRSP